MGSVLGEGTEGRNDIIPLKSQKIKKNPWSNTERMKNVTKWIYPVPRFKMWLRSRCKNIRKKLPEKQMLSKTSSNLLEYREN